MSPSDYAPQAGGHSAQAPQAPHATQSYPTYDDLTARVKHIEASLAVHDLANSGSTPPPTVAPHVPSAVPATPQETSTGDKPRYDFDANAPVVCNDFIPFVIKKSRLEFHGGSSSLALIKRDAHLHIVWLSLWKDMESAMRGATLKLEAMQKIVPVSSFKDFFLIASLSKKRDQDKLETSARMAEINSLDELIVEFLPTLNIIMRMLLRFFKVVYPFLPFISEHPFMLEIEALLGPFNFSNTKATKVIKRSKYDYATIGLLFLMLRLAYMSIEEHEFAEKPEFQGMKDLKFSIGYAQVAKKCLDHYRYTEQPYSIRVLQLILYQKLYYKYCHEDDDVADGTETKTMLGLLYSVAESLGLHVDPEGLLQMVNHQGGDSHGHLWRKIWHKILEIDSTHAVMLGTIPYCHDEDEYSTKLPEEGVNTDDVERCIVEEFDFADAKTKLYRKIAQGCFKVKRRPTALQLKHYIQEVETFAESHLGNLKQVLSDTTLKPYVKAKRVVALYELNSLLMSLQIYLLHHFIKMDDTRSLFEMFDGCLMLTMKIMNTSLNMLYNMNLYFEPGVRLFIRPAAYTAICKSLLFIASLLAKLSQCRKHVKETGNMARWSLLSDIHERLVSCMGNLLKLSSALSTEFYNSQRIVFVSKLIFEQLKDPDYDFDKAGQNVLNRPEESPERLYHWDALAPKDFPKDNFLMNLLDGELSYLRAQTQCNVNEVLRPLTSKQGVKQNVNPSGAGNGQFYDPVDGFTKSSSAAPEPPAVSPLNNPGNLFSYSDLMGEESPLTSVPSMSSGAITSDEYASLFGLFEDYGNVAIEQSGLNGI